MAEGAPGSAPDLTESVRNIREACEGLGRLGEDVEAAKAPLREALKGVRYDTEAVSVAFRKLTGDLDKSMPEMVGAIRHQFGQLDLVIVGPVREATRAVAVLRTEGDRIIARTKAAILDDILRDGPIERVAAKLFGPAGARKFCQRVEQTALLAALNLSQEAYAEELIRKGTGCWAVAPTGDKEVLINRATSHAVKYPNGMPLKQEWTPPEHKDKDLANELLELFRGVENYRGNYIGFMHLDGGGNVTVGFGHYLPRVEAALRLRDYSCSRTATRRPRTRS